MFPITGFAGEFFANIPQCTRKDLRNAVEAAAKAGPGWAKRTAYNRGQILYRLGEMIEARAGEMADAIMLGGATPAAAAREVAATVDRLIYYAGWTDKYEQVLGNVNPVAAPYFNFATSDLPGGVVNLLTGFRKELISTFATHTHLRAISAVVNAEERKALALGAADSVKRTHLRKAEDKHDWLADSAQSLEAIRETLEFKTTWHPVGA